MKLIASLKAPSRNVIQASIPTQLEVGPWMLLLDNRMREMRRDHAKLGARLEKAKSAGSLWVCPYWTLWNRGDLIYSEYDS